MNKYVLAILMLSDEVINMQYDLEDNYESSTLAKDLKNIRTKLTTIKEAKPEITKIDAAALGKYQRLATFIDIGEDRDDLLSFVDEVRERCQKALTSLVPISSKSNIFDIIDVLRDIYGHLTFFINEPPVPYFEEFQKYEE